MRIVATLLTITGLGLALYAVSLSRSVLEHDRATIVNVLP